MSIQKTDLVTIRQGVETDNNFILASWLRGLYYGDSWYRDIPKDIFMKNYHKVLTAVLCRESTIVLIACLKEDPDVILGYSVTHSKDNNTVLDWVFVKSAWRNIGIGRSLVPTNMNSVTHLSKVGKALLPKYPSVVFNPFNL